MAGRDAAAVHRVVQQVCQELEAELRVLRPVLGAAGILCERRWWDVAHGVARRDGQMADVIAVRRALPDVDAGIWAAREPLLLAVWNPAPVWSALRAPAATETRDVEAVPDKQDVDRFAV